MHKAEQRAKSGKVKPVETSTENLEEVDLQPSEETPKQWINAVLPVATMILITFLGLLMTGTESLNETFSIERLPDIIGEANSFDALMWGSLSGVIVAFLLTVSQRILTVKTTVEVFMSGLKMMLSALTILVLAWALAGTISDVKTASFIASALQDNISPYFLPMLVFLLSALIAFSTGSSWSTMAIMYPLVIPATWAICQSQGLSSSMAYEILQNVISVTLAASVMGDHCSPISDTTILSSLASGCDHREHVRTQLPYALTVGVVSFVCAGLATFLGGGWTIIIVWFSSTLLLVAIILWRGKKLENSHQISNK